MYTRVTNCYQAVNKSCLVSIVTLLALWFNSISTFLRTWRRWTYIIITIPTRYSFAIRTASFVAIITLLSFSKNTISTNIGKAIRRSTNITNTSETCQYQTIWTTSCIPITTFLFICSDVISTYCYAWWCITDCSSTVIANIENTTWSTPSCVFRKASFLP